MRILMELEQVLDTSSKNVHRYLNDWPNDLIKEYTNKGIEKDNTLYCCDNLNSMLHLISNGYGGKIDLVYIDPPFYSNSHYYKKVGVNIHGKKKDFEVLAYGDKWESKFHYLEMLATRLRLIKMLLSNRGSIYLHVDQRMVHYLRIIMDEIFGEENFINEIIWSYKSGGSSTKRFSKKHDNILAYSKTKDYIFNPQKEKSYNRGYKPYSFKNVQEFKDDLGWYTMVNMKDVWNIDMVGRTSGERVGYDTQKPYSLLKRIILASSDENSIVADFFLGSGTTIKVADDLNRRWIGSDIEPISITTTKKRLNESLNSYVSYVDENMFKNENINLDFQVIVGDKDVRLTLKNYALLDRSIFKKSNHKKEMIDLLESDSLQLIDYISIIGVNNKSELLFERYKPDISDYQIQVELMYRYQEIYLRGFDVFGNMFKYRLKGGDQYDY